MSNALSKEFIVQPHAKGMQLLKPCNKHASSNTTLGKLLQLPLNIIVLNHASIIIDINEMNAKALGCHECTDALGKTIRHFYKNECAEFSIQHDLTALNEGFCIKEEFCIRRDDSHFQTIVAKLPLYDEDNILIGLFGYSISLPFGNDFQKAMGAFSQLTTTYISSIQARIHHTAGIYLTNREAECIKHIIHGKTAKMIGKILNLSPRTIERYIDNIKIKFKVSSKSELVEKILRYNVI